MWNRFLLEYEIFLFPLKQHVRNFEMFEKASFDQPPKISSNFNFQNVARAYTYFLFTVDSFNGSTLFFWKVDRRQMGAYLCIASNDVPPAVSKRIILSVNCKYYRVYLCNWPFIISILAFTSYLYIFQSRRAFVCRTNYSAHRSIPTFSSNAWWKPIRTPSITGIKTEKSYSTGKF